MFFPHPSGLPTALLPVLSAADQALVCTSASVLVRLFATSPPTSAVKPPAAPRRLPELAGGEEILLDERVEVAIEYGFDVPHFQVGAMVFDQPIRMQDIRPDLVSPGDIFLALRILF